MLLVAEPILGDDERAGLSEVLDSGWITTGNRVRSFEKAFAEDHGAEDSVAVSSCTAALHLLLQALGVGPGDEVLVPSLTFVATVNCVLYVGADPVLVDIASLETPLLSMEDAAAKCTARTRAIVLMHYAGYLDDAAAWREFASRRGLLLVEDAAHAAGVQGAGQFGDGAAFSFYGNKNMTTAEGGAVVARDPEVLDRVRQMRGHGMVSSSLQRVTTRTADYDVTMLGYNYRMDELRAVIGLAQLRRLPSWNKKRKALTDLYRGRLQRHCPEVLVPFPENQNSAYHIMPVVLPARADRAAVIDALRNAGIQTTIHYPPAHHLSLYRARFPSLRMPVTEEFARRQLTLPLHPRMEEADVEATVAALTSVLGKQRSAEVYA